MMPLIGYKALVLNPPLLINRVALQLLFSSNVQPFNHACLSVVFHPYRMPFDCQPLAIHAQIHEIAF